MVYNTMAAPTARRLGAIERGTRGDTLQKAPTPPGSERTRPQPAATSPGTRRRRHVDVEGVGGGQMPAPIEATRETTMPTPRAAARG